MPDAAYFRELIKSGAIPATSIGWISNDRYQGWKALTPARPSLAHLAASIGAPQSEDISYFASGDVVENSLAAIPANPLALIHAAGMSKWPDVARFYGGRL